MANLYTADFETTGYEQYLKDGETRVFMYAVADINELEVVNQGTTIEEFFAFILTTRRNRSSTVYFHNLRFDGSFLLNYMLNNGWVYTKDRRQRKRFTTLIDKNGVWYGIRLAMLKASYTVYVNIYDSFKKIPLSVANTAKAYGGELAKGDFDYDMYRPKGYVPTAEEWEYVYKDVLIMAHALKTQHEEGLSKMTLSSDAFNTYSNMRGKNAMRYFFPQIDREHWHDIREAYKGGWVYANERFAGKVLEDVLSFDVNSLYSYAMYKDFDLPYGHPVLFEGRYKENKTFTRYIQRVSVSFKLKEGYLPTLQSASLGRFTKQQFVTDSEDEVISLLLTDLDLKLFLEHHTVNYIKYEYGYMFRATNDMFVEYIDRWYKAKETETGGKREIAKRLLNALYGKFGTGITQQDKTPFLDDNRLAFTLNEEYESKHLYYLPVAVFTTANARYMTISTSQALYEHHVYSDTDSIKIVGLTLEEAKTKMKVGAGLGEWGYEGRYKKAKFIRAKTYAYYDEDDNFEIVCAGMPDRVKDEVETLAHFAIGFRSENVLQQMQVKGGAVLRPIPYELKP